MKKGFTLVELLAVIVILAIILAIAIPSISNIIENSQINALKSNNKMLIKVAKTYVGIDYTKLPKELGETTEISLETLQNEGYIAEIKSPDDKNKNCNGYIMITKISETNYEYIPHLNCVNNIGSSVEDGLVGYWKLNSTAWDYSLNNNHGTIYGATTVDNGLLFDGIDDFVSVEDNSILDIVSSISIEAKVKRADVIPKVYNTIWRGLVAKGYLVAPYGLFFNWTESDNRIVFDLHDNIHRLAQYCSEGLDTNEHIITTVWDGNIIKIYLDSKLIKENSYLSTNLNINNEPLYFGYAGSDRYFPGIIYYVKLYNRALSEDEVKMMYNLEMN